VPQDREIPVDYTQWTQHLEWSYSRYCHFAGKA